MAFDVNTFPKKGEKIRVLSMDGGGIYGYIMALMLRRLCEKDEDFLSGDQVWLFAGTSAGALNSLMLARAKDPREVVMNGTLERFWHRRGTFANQLNPMASYLSWFGITGWLGAADYVQMLTEIYGDMTLADLEHRVLLTAFNWAGVGQQQLSWRPKCFVNFPEDDPDRSILVRHIAYGAAAPPGLRGVTHGIGDGGTVTPDPAMCALVETVKEYRRVESENERTKEEKELLEALEALEKELAKKRRTSRYEKKQEEIELKREEAEQAKDEREVGDPLSRIHLLSLGVCTKPGVYWLPDFDFGSTLFQAMPTNPSLGQWFPPHLQIGLDGPSEATTQHSSIMLDENFHRLDPPLLGPPEEPTTLVATAYSRFPAWQQYLLERQQVAMQSGIARDAVREAHRFLQTQWYDLPRPLPATVPATAE